MIRNEKEFNTTLKRIAHLQKQVVHLREVENNPENYRLSVGGFLSELDRMNLEVREYLWSHPSQMTNNRKTA